MYKVKLRDLYEKTAPHLFTLRLRGSFLNVGPSSGELASAELYDPATGTWTATSSLQTARDSHTATLLSTGQVLVAGGFKENTSTGTFLASAELYDPATGTWTATTSMHTVHAGHTATLLSTGRVLVVGGRDDSSHTPTFVAEIFDPQAPPPTLNGTYQGVLTATSPQNHTQMLTVHVTQSGQNLTGTIDSFVPGTSGLTLTGTISTIGEVSMRATSDQGNINFSGLPDSLGRFSGSYTSTYILNHLGTAGNWTFTPM